MMVRTLAKKIKCEFGNAFYKLFKFKWFDIFNFYKTRLIGLSNTQSKKTEKFIKKNKCGEKALVVT